jgi:hypothetical protein
MDGTSVTTHSTGLTMATRAAASRSQQQQQLAKHQHYSLQLKIVQRFPRTNLGSLNRVGKHVSTIRKSNPLR